MLGSLRSAPAQAWLWAAVGKHPAARDYIRLGADSPMTNVFAEWVAGGYRTLEVAARNRLPPPCSFRFWARGAGPGALACGVLRDSADAVGRPFPLLIMGSGALAGWEEQWDALPLACETAWFQMESLANRGLRELAPLEEELTRIRPPQPAWGRYAEEKRSALDGRGAAGAEPERTVAGAIGAGAGEAGGDASGIVPLDEIPGGDFFPLIQAWHSGLRARAKEPPSALFVGGYPQRTWLAYFRRPLAVDDFPRIWAPPAEAA